MLNLPLAAYQAITPSKNSQNLVKLSPPTTHKPHSLFLAKREVYFQNEDTKINHTTSKEINLSATSPVERNPKNREGGWEKNYQRYTIN